MSSRCDFVFLPRTTDVSHTVMDAVRIVVSRALARYENVKNIRPVRQNGTFGRIIGHRIVAQILPTEKMGSATQNSPTRREPRSQKFSDFR
jgi:hypothetical protein